MLVSLWGSRNNAPCPNTQNQLNTLNHCTIINSTIINPTIHTNHTTILHTQNPSHLHLHTIRHHSNDFFKWSSTINPVWWVNLLCTQFFSQTNKCVTFSTLGTTRQGPEGRRITADQRADGSTIPCFFFFLFFSFWGLSRKRPLTATTIDRNCWPHQQRNRWPHQQQSVDIDRYRSITTRIDW